MNDKNAGDIHWSFRVIGDPFVAENVVSS